MTILSMPMLIANCPAAHNNLAIRLLGPKWTCPEIIFLTEAHQMALQVAGARPQVSRSSACQL